MKPAGSEAGKEEVEEAGGMDAETADPDAAALPVSTKKKKKKQKQKKTGRQVAEGR